MRAIAREQVEVMAALGFDRFAVVGHDRGARCAYRMAIDHPSTVTRIGVLDIVPTGESFGRAGKEFTLGYWIWSLLAAPAPVPGTAPGRGAGDAGQPHGDSWSDDPSVFTAEMRAAYVEPLAIWRDWAADVVGAAVDCGHYLPEEVPDETVLHLLYFL